VADVGENAGHLYAITQAGATSIDTATYEKSSNNSNGGYDDDQCLHVGWSSFCDCEDTLFSSIITNFCRKMFAFGLKMRYFGCKIR
jgi:hypothetical protein